MQANVRFVWLSVLVLIGAGLPEGGGGLAPGQSGGALPAYWGQPTTDGADAAASGPARTDAPELVRLSSRQVSRIRYMELRGMRLRDNLIPDRVTVKISRDTANEFLLAMQGHKDFDSEQERRNFRKKTPPQKLHAIAQYKGAAFADMVSIDSDPEVFVEFRRHILPVVLQSCATAGCHGPHEGPEVSFHLFKDPKRSASTTYADFIILNEAMHGRDRLINRARPEDSLLLNYLLPHKDVKPEFRHPGEVDLRPIFQNKRAPGFRRIHDWISSLKHPAADYGVRLLAFPTSMPSDDDFGGTP